MRPIHLAATLVLAAATASTAEDPASALKGEWKLDRAATAEASPEYAKGSPAQQTEIKAKHAALRDTTFEFYGNELYYGHDGAVPDISTFRVLGARDGRIELELTSERYDGTVEVDKATAELIGSDQLRLVGDGTIMVFRRAQVLPRAR
jgi:hypothetical protein